MRFTELRPFGGYTLNDVLRYLRSDVPKAFNDFFAAVAKAKLEEEYKSDSQSTFVSFSASNTAEDVAGLSLGRGDWSVWGIVQFSPNGATGTLSGEAWLSLDSGAPDIKWYGQSRVQVQMASATPYVQATVFRQLTVVDKQSIQLGSKATYSSGPVKRLGSIWAIGRR